MPCLNSVNCLKSLEKIQFQPPLTCYCIGKEGFDHLTAKGYSSHFIDEEQNSNFQLFRQGNWSNITFHKFKIIHENLLKHKYVCFTDGDIVFENTNFSSYLLNHIGENDLLIQDDFYGDGENLCSGFMFIQSNPNTLALFNPAIVESKKNQKEWDDQVYINDIRDKLRYKKLPLDLFPTGNHYYKHFSTLKPYLIHFNWCLGHEKQQKMKHYNKWLL